MICWKCAILKINIHLFNCKNHFKESEQQTLEHEDTNNVEDHVSINDEVLDERDDEHDDECDNDGPLLDIEEVSESSLVDVPLNDDILEEESSNYKGFDGEYGLYFPNFTSAMIFIWITKHMICKY